MLILGSKGLKLDMPDTFWATPTFLADGQFVFELNRFDVAIATTAAL